MLDFSNYSRSSSDNKISVTDVMRFSYTYFVHNFSLFVKLSIVPMLLWILLNVSAEVLLNEYGIAFNHLIPRAFVSASFALVWYRKFLLGMEQESYGKLYTHLKSRRTFSIASILKSILRVVIIAMVILVPTLMVSLAAVVYQISQGVTITNEMLEQLVQITTFIVLLTVSPILIRFSFYSASIALGRRQTRLRDVWRKTTGYTWNLWHLVIRAFLPLSLYTYALNEGFSKIAEKFELSYVATSLLINIPSAFMVFMMLAIVVAANATAFKQIFGTGDKERT